MKHNKLIFCLFFLIACNPDAYKVKSPDADGAQASVVNSLISGTSSIAADGVTTSAVSITLLDAQSLPIVGVTPSFSASGSANTYGACSASDLSGLSVCTLASTKAEIKTLSISSPVVKAGSTVEFVVGGPDANQSTITGTGSVLADGIATSTITITLKDAGGNALAGQTPTFSATDFEAANIYGACSVTDSNGVSTCTLASKEWDTKVLSITTPVVKVGGSVVFTEIDHCTGNLANAPFADGDGSALTPYGICTAAQLNNIGADATYITKHFKLYADLDLASYTSNSFTLIASSASPFMGTFNGNRRKISNLTVSLAAAAGDMLGLFRKIGSTGVVKNLRVLSASISGRSYVGVLAGENVGIVSNCGVSGTVTGADRVGGLLGRFWESNASTYVLNSYAEVNVNGTGFVGGLIGWVRGTVTGSYAKGAVVSGGDRIGGLVGTVDLGTIINSYAEGTVSGGQLVGGLIGIIGGNISGSHSVSTVTCSSYCGGIAGSIGQGSGSGKIEKSYSVVTLNTTSYVVGGITGYSYANYNVENCYAVVTINSPSQWLGGLVGAPEGNVTNSYAVPQHIGDATVVERGGIVGEMGAATVLTGSFWNSDLDTTLVSSDGASSTTTMKTAQTYINAGWSPAIWNIVDGSYPTLK